MKKTIIVIILITAGLGICFASSLWSNSQNEKFKNLFSDNKAYRIGDILTISIVESVSLSQTDQTDNKAKGLISSTFSVIKNISNIDLSNFLPMGTDSEDTTSKTDNTVKNQVSAKIAAIITEIDATGNLIIEGRKEVKIGSDRRELVIQGLVRPSDVSATNQIDSYMIANAKLWYNGDVVFQQDPSEENWIGYILSGLSGVIF